MVDTAKIERSETPQLCAKSSFDFTTKQRLMTAQRVGSR